MRSIVAETAQRTEEHRRGRISTGLGDGTLAFRGNWHLTGSSGVDLS